MHVLEVKNLSKKYAFRNYFWRKKKITEVVNNVSLSIDPGACLGLVGESGCGKTTLGKMIAGGAWLFRHHSVFPRTQSNGH